MKTLDFTSEEKKEFLGIYRQILKSAYLSKNDICELRSLMISAAQSGRMKRDATELHPVLCDLHTVLILFKEMSLGRTAIISVVLYRAVQLDVISLREV